MRKFFIILLLLSSFASASLYDKEKNISDFINDVPKLENVVCEFKQEKHLKGLKKPVISSGNFKFIKNKGVYFETLQPVKQNVSYTNKDYKQINEIILVLSNKKYSKLEKEFNFYFEKKSSDWSLGLKPKKQNAAYDIINYISIYGNSKIDKLEISLKNGNKTIIWFQTK